LCSCKLNAIRVAQTCSSNPPFPTLQVLLCETPVDGFPTLFAVQRRKTVPRVLIGGLQPSLLFGIHRQRPRRARLQAMMSGVSWSSSMTTLSRSMSLRFFSRCNCSLSAACPASLNAPIAASRSRCSSRSRSIWARRAARSSCVSSLSIVSPRVAHVGAPAAPAKASDYERAARRTQASDQVPQKELHARQARVPAESAGKRRLPSVVTTLTNSENPCLWPSTATFELDCATLALARAALCVTVSSL